MDLTEIFEDEWKDFVRKSQLDESIRIDGFVQALSDA